MALRLPGCGAPSDRNHVSWVFEGGSLRRQFLGLAVDWKTGPSRSEVAGNWHRLYKIIEATQYTPHLRSCHGMCEASFLIFGLCFGRSALALRARRHFQRQ